MKKQTTKKSKPFLIVDSQKGKRKDVIMPIPSESRILFGLNYRDFLLKSGIHNKKIDQIQEQIQKTIRKYFNSYTVDFILETWTRFGAAPQLLYDDNGMFAITDNGIQPVVAGNQRIEGGMTAFVKKNQWKKTIRQALKLYITRK